MALAEIPEKVIEGRESFNEAQLKAAIELTKITYQSPQAHPKEEKVLQTFSHCYSQIRQIIPLPLDKVHPQKIVPLITAILVFVTLAGLTAYYIFFLHLGFSLRELLLKVT